MTITGGVKKDERPQIMRTLINNRCSLKVTRFFAAHPNGRFSRLAVIHAVDEDDRRREIEGAMADLVGAGVLKTENEHTVCYYRLTNDEPVRGIVVKTAEMDWHQWELVFVDV